MLTAVFLTLALPFTLFNALPWIEAGYEPACQSEHTDQKQHSTDLLQILLQYNTRADLESFQVTFLAILMILLSNHSIYSTSPLTLLFGKFMVDSKGLQ